MSKKPVFEDIESYIDNEVNGGRVRIGFEDVNGNVAPLTYIYKRMVSGFILTKNKFSDKVISAPIFSVGEYNEVQNTLTDFDKLLGIIPSAPCYAVFCLVPKNVSFSKLNVKPHPMKSILLGFEYPNSEHPDWIEEYKKEFINAFNYEGKDEETEEDTEDGTDDIEYTDDETRKEKIIELIKKCEEKDSRLGDE